MQIQKSVILFIYLLYTACSSAQYEINIEVKGLEGKEIILGYYFEDKQYITAKAVFDSNSEAVFSGEKKLTEGLYFIDVRGVMHFDIIVTEDQKFSISSDTIDIIKKLKISGSKDNDEFSEYQKIMNRDNKIRFNLQSQIDLLKDKDSIGDFEKKISKIDKKIEEYWQSFVEKNKGTFLSNLINCSNYLSIPYNERFERIDLSDQRLKNTPFLYGFVRSVIGHNIKKGVSVINSENDKLLKKAEVNEQMYKYISFYLLNFYRTHIEIGMNHVFVHLADNYFLNEKGNWLQPKARETIKKQADIYRSSFLGSKAYDIKGENQLGDSVSLHEAGKGKLKLIIFWKTGCDHCDDACNSVNKYFKELTKDKIVVFAVNTTETNRELWHKKLKEKNEKWVHCADFSGKSRYKEYYYVSSTPMMYIIDQNNMIINKLYGPEQIEDLFKRKYGEK